MTTNTRPQAPRCNDVIDLERYPIRDRASTGYQALVQGCGTSSAIAGSPNSTASSPRPRSVSW